MRLRLWFEVLQGELFTSLADMDGREPRLLLSPTDGLQLLSLHMSGGTLCSSILLPALTVLTSDVRWRTPSDSLPLSDTIGSGRGGTSPLKPPAIATSWRVSMSRSWLDLAAAPVGLGVVASVDICRDMVETCLEIPADIVDCERLSLLICLLLAGCVADCGALSLLVCLLVSCELPPRLPRRVARHTEMLAAMAVRVEVPSMQRRSKSDASMACGFDT
mmetsp:Transcript_45181/g.130865  ORF Transcript_45181/g.130865 Transcript_45181/m.130865 type:complete len:219 (-) Transcript_45181:506-1162(-)